MAVSDYFQLTKGTVSQSLKILEVRGYVEKRPNNKDGRSVHLYVSGAALLAAHWPPLLLRNAVQQLSAVEEAEIQQALQTLLTALQRGNEQQRFGICATCRYHQAESTGYRCGLTGETLLPNEIDLICREHEPQPNINYAIR